MVAQSPLTQQIHKTISSYNTDVTALFMVWGLNMKLKVSHLDWPNHKT